MRTAARSPLLSPDRISEPPSGRRRSEIQPPGTEFLDAETGGQNSTRETANVCRDRKGRNNTGGNPRRNGLFGSTWKSAVREDWVVVCAVRYEPVSTRKFPVNRENTGKFCDSSAGLASVRAKNPSAAMVSLQIPCANYQGKIIDYQGSKISRRGFLYLEPMLIELHLCQRRERCLIVLPCGQAHTSQ